MNKSFFYLLAVLVTLLCAALPSPIFAAANSDYCVTPPYIPSGIPPNLLLMLDNSASMYDLQYSDMGKTGLCSSTTTTQVCYQNADCPASATCISSTGTRFPYYCYDETFSTANAYAGYFDSAKYYQYDFANDYFVEIATFPSSCTGTGCAYISGVLSIDGTNLTSTAKPKSITAFYAKGSYLNWLSSSKFDVQKQILTGGKYVDKLCYQNGVATDASCVTNANCPSGQTGQTWTCTDVTNFLQAESRGCVGHAYIKEALTGNFVNYSAPESNNTNTPLKITFGVRGPLDPSAPTTPSPGGQTYIDIYGGADYDQSACQNAIKVMTDLNSSNAAVKTAVSACLASQVGSDLSWETLQKTAFNQTIQACWAYSRGTDIGIDEANTVKNQCAGTANNTIYKNTPGYCSNDQNHSCTSDANCTIGTTTGTCELGPDAIIPGMPGLLCSRDFAGACNTGTAANWNSWTGSWSGAYKDLSGNIVYGTWDSSSPPTYDENACIIAATKGFCYQYKASNNVDPTDDPSVTSNYQNLPAILGDISVQSQLDKPVKSLKVRLRLDTAPTRLVQEFSGRIRMGAMTFNDNGSKSECGTSSTVPCPKVCSNDTNRICGSALDCSDPEHESCDVATNNLDGAKVISYIGIGTCSATTSQACTTNANCPSGQYCVSSGAGDHNSGLIHEIDNIKATSWTPFAEAFYEAIGYLASDKRCSNNANMRCASDSDCPGNGTCPSTGPSRTDFRLSTDDYDASRNPSQSKCQKNNILLITDGMSTADQNTYVNTFASLYTSTTMSGPGYGPGSACGTLPFKGSINLDNLAWAARHRSISKLLTDTEITDDPFRDGDYITTYVVLSGASNGLSGECNSQTLLSNTAFNGGTSLYTAGTSTQLEKSIRDALDQISSKASAGTAASVLASGEGSGANLIQAVFYPTKKFINTAADGTNNEDEVMWVGRLTNLWYYVDPLFANSNIREDDGVVDADGNKVLYLKTDAGHHDNIVQLYFDASPGEQKTKAHQWTDPNGTGVVGTALADIPFENIPSLWEAGLELWKRDLATSPRTIYTNISSNSTPTLIPFVATAGTSSTLASYLQAADATEASKIISWVTGSDDSQCPNEKLAQYRCRTVKVDLNGDEDTLDASVGGFNENVPRVWKLGDILNSTPKISSWIPLNQFNKIYLDQTYGLPGADADLASPVDANHYLTTQQYKNRGMIFTGANDGMLHAFRLGTLRLKWDGQGQFEKARLEGDDLGKEMWAFIPKNVLPYLKYTAKKGYCHVYSVDLTPYIFDASIARPAACTISDAPDDTNCTRAADSWRTILIGGMRYGGACKNMGTACAGGGADCVKTPADGKGYSSYFALDITDQNSPVLMWEFTNTDLGFSTTGPSIVRINSQSGTPLQPDKTKNGHWYVVIGSGPTGPINTDVHQFMGRSDQNLRLFVLDLKTGNLLRTISPTDGLLNIPNAFAGSMLNSTFDTDLNYSDDVVYIPYVRKCTSTSGICNEGDWTDGGVLRLFTKEDPEVSHWVPSTVIDGVGPVTSAVVKLQNNNTHTLWLYFGAGRYYYSQLTAKDDQDGKRQIFGIKEPTYKMLGSNTSGFDTADNSSVSFCATPCANPTASPACTQPNGSNTDCGFLRNVTDISKVPPDPTVSSFKGWYVNLDPSGSYTYPPSAATSFAAERNITDPLATSTGVVFFTTFKPYSDECQLTGKSALWAFKYDTGGSAGALLKGKALVQVSTGAIEQVNLSDAFTEKGGRETAGMEGVPPTAQGLSILSPPQPVKRIIHIKER